ncbi:tumor protein D52 isoform X2 [Culex quinquefasciatus]|uniref:tumor protein D52 isoform X2 n=1 Tax=Culex quinquefasciatus TaxID=7176 RepID=UPI0018E2EA9B|nr:tumor protein D52 isoform X2 [Culex quinquefasciatus]
MRVGEDELPSLEYIEDPYIPKLDNCLTPSLDDISEYNVEELLGDEQNWPEETEQYLRSLTLDQILGVSSDEDIDPDPDGFLEMQTVETEFSPQLADSRGNGASGATNLRAVEPGDGVGGAVMRNLLAHRLLNGRQASKLNQLFSKRRIRDVRVTFIDFSKPYLARISSGDNYKSFLNIGSATDNSGKLSDASPVGSVSSAEIAQEFSGLTVEEQEAQRAEWSQELARVEEEITTLRTVLQSKIRHAGELKRKLGITVWKEITDDMSQGIKNVKESNVYQSVETKVGEITTAVTSAPIYQKTETAIKTTAGKTTSVLGGFTSKLTGKISEMKQSDSFRSFEERVGSAYENVRSKVSSRSSSVQSLSDLQNDERRSSVTTPTAIPEEKTVP